MSAEKTLLKLAEKGIFICSDKDFETSKVMLLKSEKDEVLFKFKLVEGRTTLDSLCIRLDKIKDEIFSCL